MNILWLSHVVPFPPRGGVLQRSYHLLKELASHHDVTLWAIVQPEWLKVTHGDVEAGLAEAYEELSSMCVDVHFERLGQLESATAMSKMLSYVRPGGYTANWLRSRSAKRSLERFARGEAFDALHVDTISMHAYRKILPGLAATLTHHNIESHMMLRRAELEPTVFKRFVFNMEGRRLTHYERSTASAYDAHIVCSTLDANRLRESYGQLETVVVPNAVDIEFFSPQQAKKDTPPSLVFAGNMSWYPNRDAMLHFANDIWPLVREKVPGLVMNLVGAHAPQELISLSQKDSRFRVLGFVNEVRDPIADAAVYVCPIRDGGGTKLKILDALAMGKAIVAHPVACEGIDVTDGLNVVLAEDVTVFADQVVDLIANHERRHLLEVEARKLAVNKYSSREIGRTLAATYERIYAGRRPLNRGGSDPVAVNQD